MFGILFIYLALSLSLSAKYPRNGKNLHWLAAPPLLVTFLASKISSWFHWWLVKMTSVKFVLKLSVKVWVALSGSFFMGRVRSTLVSLCSFASFYGAFAISVSFPVLRFYFPEKFFTARLWHWTFFVGYSGLIFMFLSCLICFFFGIRALYRWFSRDWSTIKYVLTAVLRFILIWNILC